MASSGKKLGNDTREKAEIELCDQSKDIK